MTITNKSPHIPMLSRCAALTAFFAALATPLRVSGVATQQVAMGLALLAALALLVLDPASRQRVRQAILSPFGRAIAAVFLAWAITAFFSFNPLGSLKIGGRSALFILGAVAIWATLAQHDEIHRLLWKTLILAAIASTVLALLSLGGVPKVGELLKGQWSDFRFPSVVFKAFATSAMCLIPVVVWVGRRLGGKWRLASYTFAPLALAVMLMTYNRSAQAGLIAMTIAGVFVLAIAKRRHTKIMLATAIAATGAIIARIVTTEVHYLQALEKNTGAPLHVQTYLPTWLLDPHRQQIWKFAFERFLDHPWVGNGIDQLNRLPGAKMGVPGLESSAAFVPSHPHNWMMEVLAETGLLGFVPMVLVLLALVWTLARNYMRHDDEADLVLLMLTAGFWGSALFNFSIWAAWWQLTFFVLFAIVAGTRENISVAGTRAKT